MQVTKITNIPGQPKRAKKLVTTEDLKKEVDYWRSYKIIQKMLENGLISEVEFKKINALNCQSFSPMLSELMA